MPEQDTASSMSGAVASLHEPDPGLWGLLRKVKRFDDQRPSVPGEHWLAAGTGAALLWRARRTRSPLLRAAGLAGGVLLLVRGVSGRDGLLARLDGRRTGG